MIAMNLNEETTACDDGPDLRNERGASLSLNDLRGSCMVGVIGKAHCADVSRLPSTDDGLSPLLQSPPKYNKVVQTFGEHDCVPRPRHCQDLYTVGDLLNSRTDDLRHNSLDMPVRRVVPSVTAYLDNRQRLRRPPHDPLGEPFA
jgi:hypothetical protein